MTNLEALACGTPVVTYRSGGSVETVSEETGVAIDKGDVGHLINTVCSIKAKDIGIRKEPCLMRARQFSRDEKYEEYIELYKGTV